MGNMQETELLEDEGTALAIYGPLDALVAEYRKKRADIVRIAGYVAGETEVIGYFMEGARVEESFSHFSATKLFEEGHAVRALDASFWSRAIALTDVLELMPADERNKWSEGIRNHKTPPFDPGTVKSTLEVLLSKRAEFFAARVDGLFRALSDVHLTNQPEGFAKRMILNWMLSYGSINHSRCNYIHDLRAVCSRFMGRDDPTSISTYQDLERIVRSGRFGEWHSFDGGAFKVRLYKKATAHLEVAPELAWRLNQILAFKNPMAIPSEFRRKPTKVPKEHVLDYDLVSFATIAALAKGNIRQDCHGIWFYDPIGPATADTLRYLGGTPDGTRTGWEFPYPVTEVLAELQRTGKVPEQVSHQFYETNDKLAQIVVAKAGIKEGDFCVEPEAGQGGIAKHMPQDRTICVEVSKLHAKILEAKGYTTVCTDFLRWQPPRPVNKICMNPPFSSGRAVDHVRHAASLLAPMGRLVSILPASNKGKILVEGMEHEYSAIYDNEFKGASVSVVILTLDKGLIL